MKVTITVEDVVDGKTTTLVDLRVNVDGVHPISAATWASKGIMHLIELAADAGESQSDASRTYAVKVWLGTAAVNIKAAITAIDGQRDEGALEAIADTLRCGGSWLFGEDLTGQEARDLWHRFNAAEFEAEIV